MRSETQRLPPRIRGRFGKKSLRRCPSAGCGPLILWFSGRNGPREKKNKRTESSPREYIQSRPPLAEKSIRELVTQTNEDLAASGVPLHLALVKNEEGFTLDVYDCSDNTVCELSQEVPLDLDNLLTILDNLEHEDGIIVNIKT